MNQKTTTPDETVVPNTDTVDTLLRKAMAHHRAGRTDLAAAGYRAVLAVDGAHGDALHLLGVLCHHGGERDRARRLIERALARHPGDPLYLNSLGLVLAGEDDTGAMRCFRQALASRPDYEEAALNLGMTLTAAGRLADAEAIYRRIIAGCPNHPRALFQMGEVHLETGRAAAAEDCLVRALEIVPDWPEPLNALALLRLSAGRSAEAAQLLERCVQARPDFVEAWINLGTAYQDSGRPDMAAACFRKALALDGQSATAWNNLGMSCQIAGDVAGALDHFRRALKLKPDYADAAANRVHQLQWACQWDQLPAAEAHLDRLTDRALAAGKTVAEQPFVSLARGLPPRRQLAIARAWSDRAAQSTRGLPGPFRSAADPDPHGPITIGYLSGNFRNHPMAHLMASLFMRHDRRRFTVHGYSFGRDDGSDYRRRIAEGCDRFVDIKNLTPHAAARRIRDDGVDILIDLMGHTRDNRMGICAFRPAPVQMRYLGLAGTSGAPFFDYIICDRVVVPASLTPHYSEQPLYMPHCYQVNDRRQPVSDRVWTRQEAGLPDRGTVFCCFNQAYKIDPLMFAAWMTVLDRVPGAVLWLLDTNDLARENLRAGAAGHGVDPHRLLFAPKLPKQAHLSRLKLADIALDTRLVSGAATTSDALWAGVPVIALRGEQFAANMSSSILTAIGAGDLVTDDVDGFVDLAVALAMNPRQLSAWRRRLTDNRLTTPLFDTDRFARDLEAGLAMAWQRHCRGQAPAPIHVNGTADGRSTTGGDDERRRA